MLKATLHGPGQVDGVLDALLAAGTAVGVQALASKSALGADILKQACDLAKGPAGAASLTSLIDPKKNPAGFAELAKYVQAGCTGVATGAAAAAAGVPVNQIPGVGTYPPGSITALAPTGVWMIAAPIGASFSIVGQSPMAPPGVTVVDYATFQKQTGTAPWYKNPLYLAGAGVGGLLVIGLFIAAVK